MKFVVTSAKVKPVGAKEQLTFDEEIVCFVFLALKIMFFESFNYLKLAKCKIYVL